MSGERDAILAALEPVMDGIVATFGDCCEVVVHDFRQPENSVVAIAGSVTGRSVGGAMSEIGMGLLAQGDTAEDQLNYITRTAAGKMVKSSTMLLRDSENLVFGALCVNLDLSGLTQVQQLLGGLAGVAAPVATTTFGDDIDLVIDSIVDSRQLDQGRSWAELSREERLALFRDLEQRGVFAVRRAVPRVAARLGISRASAYAYLAETKENA
ncbi:MULTISPECIES: transcriptional regulator [unclassified Crossiella]|uniref:helix-turn-helix transcriptional regulator n=1 Tax=unclassified Crossiella TaxID=2620835 RepID=UPI001FFFE2E2|nr:MULTISPECIES: helix-turn-helix transcriptional regulator [unclassified Crossiella]MCK2239917.1 helix-turn-helix transcriptional regulator [Crossiella sp. S99.2]MCK2252625.1 helix-turn-helix transcriptional regulator [Crossiella sp. S99.1]